MTKEKPCDVCLVLPSCSHVCEDFLQWCVDMKKLNLKCHPHYQTASISTQQVVWVNEKMKEYQSESISFIMPD